MIGQALSRGCVVANFLGAIFRIERRKPAFRPYRSHAETELPTIALAKKGVIDDLGG